jgi:hypothetical protein
LNIRREKGASLYEQFKAQRLFYALLALKIKKKIEL